MILNESAIASSTLNPVIRRQVAQHVGPRDAERLIVRVYHARRGTHLSGRASIARRLISVCIPLRLFRRLEDWQTHAPALAQLVAVLAARFSRRHARLAQSPAFRSQAPATILEFAAAREIPFVLRDALSRQPLEARLEWIALERRRTEETFRHARARYQRYRKWEKVLRLRLRKMGSQL